jgi:hypothetical protein
MIEYIGKITGKNLEELHQWCEDRKHLLKPTLSRYAIGRKELWVRRYCDLRKTPTITEGFRDERLEALGERLLPDFHIGLVLLYQPGVKIGLHRDHSVLKPLAASVNLGEVMFLMAELPCKGEKLKPKRYHLKDGEVTRFNTKILHGIEPVISERWSIMFWHLKDIYL